MNRLTNPILQRLLSTHGLYMAGRAFLDIFMNIYIWKLSNDIVLVAWYNIVRSLTHTAMFTLFARLVKVGHIKMIRQTGIFGLGLIYLAIFVLRDTSINYIISIALAFGLFNSMYWISYHVSRFDLTQSENRGNYSGVENAVGIIISIAIPVIGGFIISMNFFNLGYANIFLLGLILFLVAFFIGSMIIIKPKEPESFHFWKSVKLMWHDKDIVKSMASNFFGGLGRSGALVQIILPIYIFDILKNEFQLGGWLSLFAVASVIISLLFGKYIKYCHYRKSILGGGVSIATIMMLLIFLPSLLIYVLFGIVNKIFSPVIYIPRRVISENLIQQLPNYKTHRVEYIVAREWLTVGLGRLSSYVLLLFVGGLATNKMKFVLFIMALMIIWEGVLIAMVNRNKYITS